MTNFNAMEAWRYPLEKSVEALRTMTAESPLPVRINVTHEILRRLLPTSVVNEQMQELLEDAFAACKDEDDDTLVNLLIRLHSMAVLGYNDCSDVDRE